MAERTPEDLAKYRRVNRRRMRAVRAAQKGEGINGQYLNKSESVFLLNAKCGLK